MQKAQTRPYWSRATGFLFEVLFAIPLCGGTAAMALILGERLVDWPIAGPCGVPLLSVEWRSAILMTWACVTGSAAWALTMLIMESLFGRGFKVRHLLPGAGAYVVCGMLGWISGVWAALLEAEGEPAILVALGVCSAAAAACHHFAQWALRPRPAIKPW